MAYTPYSQALPDTSRYTLDPVLQERLYQPVKPDPYQAGLLSTTANDYYADPFGYTNRRFGKLDEILATDKSEVGLGGMFAPYLKNEGSPGDSTGLTPEQIAFLDAETAGERDARMGRISSMLSLFAHGIVPALPALSISKMGLEAYNNMIQGHARTVAGDPYGLKDSNPVVPGREPGRPAPVVTAKELQALTNSGWNPEGTQYTSSYGTTTDAGSISSAESAGLDAARGSYGYGSDANYYGD